MLIEGKSSCLIGMITVIGWKHEILSNIKTRDPLLNLSFKRNLKLVLRKWNSFLYEAKKIIVGLSYELE